MYGDTELMRRRARDLREQATEIRRRLLELREGALSQPLLVREREGIGALGPRLDLDRKAAAPEHLDHPVVLRQDLGDELGEPVFLGHLGEVGEDDRAEAAPLHLARHREGDFGLARMGFGVDAVPDRVLAAAAAGDDPVAAAVVDLRHQLRRALEVGRAGEEAQRLRAQVEVAEEDEEALDVIGPDRPQVNGGAVAEDDVAASSPTHATNEASMANPNGANPRKLPSGSE